MTPTEATTMLSGLVCEFRNDRTSSEFAFRWYSERRVCDVVLEAWLACDDGPVMADLLPFIGIAVKMDGSRSDIADAIRAATKPVDLSRLLDLAEYEMRPADDDSDPMA